jgi:hypothetical protein
MNKANPPGARRNCRRRAGCASPCPPAGRACCCCISNQKKHTKNQTSNRIKSRTTNHKPRDSSASPFAAELEGAHGHRWLPPPLQFTRRSRRRLLFCALGYLYSRDAAPPGRRAPGSVSPHVSDK